MSYNPYMYNNDQRNLNGSQMNPGMNPNMKMNGGQPMPQHFQGQGQQGQQYGNQPAHSQGAGFQDPRQTMAFQLGQSAFSNLLGQQNFSQFQDTVNKATAGSNASLSHYFQVSTAYVLSKLRLILMPFINKNNWQRIPEQSNSNSSGSSGSIRFMSPMNDVNSPDMYIPIMGLVTYISIWNVQQGLNGLFNPENLYYKLSSTLAFVLLDLVILKLGLYLLVTTNSSNFPSVTSITELLCYVGYKFVPLTTILLLPNLYLPTWLTLLFKLYLFIALGVFLLRSIKFNLFNNPNEDIMNVKKSTVKRCNYFLFFYGFVWQSVLMWLIG